MVNSFRDPSSKVVMQEGKIVRYLDDKYLKHYEHLMSSGLYELVSEENLLVTHTEGTGNTIYPEVVPFISYSYEWCFSQLRNAGLLTLRILKTALEYEMTLKDATAYNTQFFGNKPIFIDTASFEIYEKDSPWVAYKQFCQHYIAPLALMMLDSRLGKMSAEFTDGVPIDLATKILQGKYRIGMLGLHLYLHTKYQAETKEVVKVSLSKQKLTGLIMSLVSCLNNMKYKTSSFWTGYDKTMNYTDEAVKVKEGIVNTLYSRVKPGLVIDLGTNTGNYAKMLADKAKYVIAVDNDHDCIEKLYKDNVSNVLPLVIDLANPTPGLGWINQEHDSFLSRLSNCQFKSKTVLALAVIHHLAISNNIPLSMIAELMQNMGDNLIIEWIPKEDSNCQRLLKSKKDVFEDYTQGKFEYEFGKYFNIAVSYPIPNTLRVIYLMTRRV